MTSLSEFLLAQWKEIRCQTYDYLAMLSTSDLAETLPFPESQSLGYQFRCMTGAHESYLRKLETGAWQGFASSLDQYDAVTPAIIAQQMRIADASMETQLSEIDLENPLSNGQPGYEVVMQMIKHEMHHHGQLINFMYCLHLPIPESWQDEWALSRNE